MSDGTDDRNDPEELTEEERDALAALPRERVPPAQLEERVVGALRAEGLLGERRRPARGWLAALGAREAEEVARDDVAHVEDTVEDSSRQDAEDDGFGQLDVV